MCAPTGSEINFGGVERPLGLDLVKKSQQLKFQTNPSVEDTNGWIFLIYPKLLTSPTVETMADNRDVKKSGQNLPLCAVAADSWALHAMLCQTRLAIIFCEG